MRKKAACRFAAFIPQPRASWTVPLLLAGALLGSQPLLAEWPQILGPERNGQVAEPLPTSFPAGGPRALWRYSVGEGMAGVAVAGGKALVFHRPGGVERLEALDAKTGASLWRSDAPASYRGGILPDSGPRAVPTVHGDAALVLGAGGLLRAHSLSDGAERWRVDLADTFAAPEGYFGFGSSPLVLEAGERALVIVPAGGDRSAVVAYDLASGRLAWRAGEDRASYSSPIVATLGGRRQVVASTRMHTVGLEPGSGRELWRVPFGRRGPSVVAAVPVVAGGRLLLTAAYGVGGLLLDFSAAREPQSVWKGDQLSSHYPTPVVLGGHIYGATGREDHGNGQLRALEL
ncbi:MAG: PQQ-binding-like beta-propeller repeat protein, partial [Acidobacteriota bacterium]